MICKEYSRLIRMKDLCAAVGSWFDVADLVSFSFLVSLPTTSPKSNLR